MTIQCTEQRINSGRGELTLYLRNKRTWDAGRTLLMIHGATYPGSGMFDYAVDGESWMDWLAARGFDVWCMDIPGYGQSDRPPEMDAPAEANGPIVDTAEAVRCVKLAIEHICRERAIDALDLLGYSWGTAISGQVASEVPSRIERLVLYGALWTRVAEAQLGPTGNLGAYRYITAAEASARWLFRMSDEQKARLGPPERMTQWAEDLVRTDPDAGRHDPPAMRAPTGVVKDVVEYWMQRQATWDPGLITAPTLIVVGEWDVETTPEQGLDVFNRLSATPEKRYTVIGAGTHTLLLENQRHQLYSTVAEFLGEG